MYTQDTHGKVKGQYISVAIIKLISQANLIIQLGIFGRQTEMEMFGAPNFHGQPTHNNDLECLQWGGRYSCKVRGFTVRI